MEKKKRQSVHCFNPFLWHLMALTALKLLIPTNFSILHKLWLYRLLIFRKFIQWYKKSWNGILPALLNLWAWRYLFRINNLHLSFQSAKKNTSWNIDYKYEEITIGMYPSVLPPIIPPVIARKVAKDSESKDKHDAKNQYCWKTDIVMLSWRFFLMVSLSATNMQTNAT